MVGLYPGPPEVLWLLDLYAWSSEFMIENSWLLHEHKQLRIISLQETGSINAMGVASGARFLSSSLWMLSIASILLNVMNVCCAWEP